ncbi:hypothetical protein IW261DRAFT_1418679 [Armillaria novae-zelandiae]|uniref:Uncharacterized protein n=1 Tax=Armillaria novae-zelandiae TaxID=153914 RepID=A0AA39UCK8_9AGAR|nr:hypothetical protein IW261DRAFT_1418679 [Armillaria novae-zelandiae]
MANSIAKTIGTVDTATNIAMVYIRNGQEITASFLRPLYGNLYGGPTIIKLQYLLKQGYFGGRDHPDMILSITTISSPFRGTPIVYTLGEHIDAAPAVRPCRFCQTHSTSGIRNPVHFHSMIYPSLDLSENLGKSSWATSRDAAPFDVTFMAADEREAKMEGEPNPGTFYTSFAAFMGRDLSGDSCIGYATNIGQMTAWYRYFPNGILCHAGVAIIPGTDIRNLRFRNLGVWQTQEVADATHASVVPLWLSTPRQKLFWAEVGDWLRKIDGAEGLRK